MSLASKEGDEDWAHKVARELACSTDTVYWYSVAYKVFVLLCREPVKSEVFDNMHQVRASLSIKHFTLLSRAWKEYEFSIEEAVQYLVDAGETRISATHMQSLIKAEHVMDLEHEEWMSHFTKIFKRLNKYQHDYKLPEEVRKETQKYMKTLRKYGVPYE